jgi:hypothetical protein
LGLKSAHMPEAMRLMKASFRVFVVPPPGPPACRVLYIYIYHQQNMYLCICMYVCMYIHIYMYTYISINPNTHTHTHTRTQTHKHTHTHTQHMNKRALGRLFMRRHALKMDEVGVFKSFTDGPLGHAAVGAHRHKSLAPFTTLVHLKEFLVFFI